MTKLGNYTYSQDGPECPYCGREFTPDEGYYYEKAFTSMDCDECEKTFKVEVYHSTSWRCHPIDPPLKSPVEP